MQRRARQSGFSLLELITVVVLLGILAGGAGLLITRPIEAYDAQVRRQQLVDQGEMALRQIAREVRRALPNSLRLTAAGSGVAVELVPTLDGARYRDEIDQNIGSQFVNDVDILEFDAPDREFNLLGRFNDVQFASGNTISGTRRLVIYNTAATGTSSIYADAANNPDPAIVTNAGIDIALGETAPPSAELRLTLSADFQFRQRSPGQRLFVIDQPISYICNPGTGRIVRHTGYGYLENQSAVPGGTDIDPVITRLDDCSMSYSPGTSQRGGILTVEIAIADGNEVVNLLHQIRVLNLP